MEASERKKKLGTFYRIGKKRRSGKRPTNKLLHKHSYLLQQNYVSLIPYIFLVKKRILRYQSGSLGLFPHRPFGDNPAEGHVRNNVYCAQVVWALALAYRYCTYFDV